MDEEKEESIDALAEKRRFPRLVASVDVEYKVLEKDLPKKETVTRNIGAGGICLIVYEKIAVDSVLFLKLHLPENYLVIEAEGRVVWSSHFIVDGDGRERYDLGIEFTQINEADRQKLSKYVFKLINSHKLK